MLARRAAHLPLETMTAVFISSLTLVALLGIGAVHVPVMAVVAALSTCALVCAMLLGFEDERQHPLTWPALVCWGLAAWSLIQLVPLPISVLERLAPVNADVWTRYVIPLGEKPPSFAPITLDPGATWIEVMRWYSYGAVLIAASVLASRRGKSWLLALVFVSAIALAAMNIAHGLLGIDKVYGFYAPTRQLNWRSGPLLNPNNLAAVLNLGAMCGLGLLLSHRPPTSRWYIGAGVASLVAAGIISASRAGVAMLLIGVVSLALVTELLRRRRIVRSTSIKTMRLALGGTLVVGLSFALLAMKRAGYDELLDESLHKLGVIAAVKPAVPDFMWFGMGRGAFESVFPAYQQADSAWVYTHAENFVLQWTVGWGLPVTVLALLTFGFLLRPRRLGVGRDGAAAAAWIGVMMVLAHNLADIGMDVPGVCIAVAIAFGALWGDRSAGHQPGLSRASSETRRLRWAMASASTAIVLIPVASLVGYHDLTLDKMSLRRAMVSPARTGAHRDALYQQVRKSMARHPAEPYFPLIGALLAWEHPGDNPMPWLQRVLERNMVNGRAHLLLARVLHRHGALRQALFELRLAVMHEHRLTRIAAAHALRWTSDLTLLAEAVPEGEDAAASWDALGALASTRELGAECDKKALEVEPGRAAPRTRLAGDLITMAERHAGRCKEDRDACKNEVESHAVAIEKAEPNTSAATVLRARWLSATGNADEAEKRLATTCDTVTDPVECLRARADIAAKLEDPERFADAARQLRALGCHDAQKCSEISAWIGDLHVQRQELGAAVASYERALRDRETEAVLLKLAGAASKAGLNSKAIRALERLLTLHGGNDPELVAKIHAERKRAVDAILR